MADCVESELLSYPYKKPGDVWDILARFVWGNLSSFQTFTQCDKNMKQGDKEISGE